MGWVRLSRGRRLTSLQGGIPSVLVCLLNLVPTRSPQLRFFSSIPSEAGKVEIGEAQNISRCCEEWQFWVNEHHQHQNIWLAHLIASGFQFLNIFGPHLLRIFSYKSIAVCWESWYPLKQAMGFFIFIFWWWWWGKHGRTWVEMVWFIKRGYTFSRHKTITVSLPPSLSVISSCRPRIERSDFFGLLNHDSVLG